MGAGVTREAVLTIDRLRVQLGGREIVRGVTLQVARGEVVALMGASGAGKSTVLRVVAALQPFEQGAVSVGNIALVHGHGVPHESALRATGFRRVVGMVFQAPSLFTHLSALDNVTLALIHALRIPRAESERTAMELLTELGVAARAHALPHQLSGGEAQRVAIARALAPDPDVLLMDEPTAALDPARRTSLGKTLRQLARDGRGILIATHDVDFSGDVCDRVAVLADGTIVEEGAARTVLASPKHDATRKLLHHEGES